MLSFTMWKKNIKEVVILFFKKCFVCYSINYSVYSFNFGGKKWTISEFWLYLIAFYCSNKMFGNNNEHKYSRQKN